MPDEDLIKRLVQAVREDGDGMTVGELAEALGRSRPTVAKYLEICEARKLVTSTMIASARFVTMPRGVIRRGPGVER